MAQFHDFNESPRVRSLARWLTFATLLLIIYGSLFPFRFSSLRHADLWELITSLAFVRASRGDLMANLLLYLPFGLCLLLSWPARWTPSKGFFCAVLLGTLLSLSIELLQVYSLSRVSSLTDLVLNASGTAIGALGAIFYLAIGSRIHIPGIASGRPDPVPLGLIALWVAFRLAPFVPTIDWQQYKDGLTPLLREPELAWAEVFRYLVGWLVVGYAVGQVWRREYATYACAALIGLVLMGRVVVVGKTLPASELAALGSCIPVAAVFIVMTDRRRALALVLMLLAVIVIAGLKPFTLQGQTQSFSWVPFMSLLSDNVEVNYAVLLEKCFWYFALIWLLARCGAAIAAAAFGTATLIGLIEFAQLWIPGRSAEITDPLLAVSGGVLLAMLGTSSRSRIHTHRRGGGKLPR